MPTKTRPVTKLAAVQIYTILLIVGALVFVAFLIGAGLVYVSQVSETQAVNSFLEYCDGSGLYEESDVSSVELLASFSLGRFPDFHGENAAVFRLLDAAGKDRYFVGLQDRGSHEVNRCVGEMVQIPGTSVRALRFSGPSQWFLIGEINPDNRGDIPLFVRLDVQDVRNGKAEIFHLLPSVYGREFITYGSMPIGEKQEIKMACPIYTIPGRHSYGMEECPSPALSTPFDMTRLSTISIH